MILQSGKGEAYFTTTSSVDRVESKTYCCIYTRKVYCCTAVAVLNSVVYSSSTAAVSLTHDSMIPVTSRGLRGRPLNQKFRWAYKDRASVVRIPAALQSTAAVYAGCCSSGPRSRRQSTTTNKQTHAIIIRRYHAAVVQRTVVAFRLFIYVHNSR